MSTLREEILKSKQASRREQAALPMLEKFRILRRLQLRREQIAASRPPSTAHLSPGQFAQRMVSK